MSLQLVVGDYELLEQLGEGAAGVAFRAQHRETGEAVALKLLHAEVEADIDLQRRFVREVSVLERLDHPNIVAYRDCGIHEGKLYLAMEFVESGSLDSILQQYGTLPWEEALEVATHVCDGLAHAHAQGVIHRDLKPANLFVASDGTVKVGDFGLARDLSKGRLTIEGQTVGTCRFMAPEQIQGQAALTGAVDLYALGCLIFKMTTGEPPYDGSGIIEIFEQHLRGPIPSLQDRAPTAPPSLDTALRWLLAKAPGDRPANAAEAKKLLTAVLKGKPVPEPVITADTPSAAPAAATTPRANSTGQAIAAGLVVLGLIGLVAWIATSQ